MARRMARLGLIAGIVGAAVVAVSYLASSAEITDLKLRSIDAARLKTISVLMNESAPETPVFRVTFSTSTDLVALANGLDAYTIRNQVLVGDGCNPALKTMSYARVAFMLVDFSRVFDKDGNVEGRGFGARDASDDYVFYFGVNPSELSEFASSGLKEAPLCFALSGTSLTGRRLSSNLVLLPMEALADAASRLGS